MEKKFKILFCMTALNVHLNPAHDIAKQLIERGHIISYHHGCSVKGNLLKAKVNEFYSRDKY